MGKKGNSDTKKRALSQSRTLHPRPDEVTDALFEEGGFFDPRDLVQVKYEMLRRVKNDGIAVTTATTRFGLSRPSFYQAHRAFEEKGLRGLMPQKKGPRRAHKLSAEVMTLLTEKLGQNPELTPMQLVEILQENFNIAVHPRSIERALLRAEKKTP